MKTVEYTLDENGKIATLTIAGKPAKAGFMRGLRKAEAQRPTAGLAQAPEHREFLDRIGEVGDELQHAFPRRFDPGLRLDHGRVIGQR